MAYVGVALYASSGLILGALPVFEFRKKGAVKKGQSYVHTTKVVDTGIYSVVRHPQYVTFIMWGFSGMLLFQHWIVVLLGASIIPLTYIDLFREDKACVGKVWSGLQSIHEKGSESKLFTRGHTAMQKVREGFVELF